LAQVSIHDALEHAMRCQQRGQLPEAETIYLQIIELAPGNSNAWNYLGILHHQRQNDPLAIEHVKQAIELKPKIALYHNTLALIYLSADSLKNAEESCRQALDLKPNFTEAWENLSQILLARGDTEQAQECLQEVVKITHDPTARFNAAVMLPVIYQSNEELKMWRKRLLVSLDDLVNSGFRFDPTIGLRKRSTLFYLCYQGLHDRQIHETTASMCLHSGKNYVLEGEGNRDCGSKLKIGFISPHFHLHTIGKVYGGLISRLQREKIEVTVLSLGNTADFITHNLISNCDRFITLPADTLGACQTAAALELDVLVYTDIGMHPDMYAMALSRLAPIQCLLWGHPVTSGLPTIDYFISSELLEDQGADEHYTEKLIRLSSLGIYHERPKLPNPALTRTQLGLPQDANLYGCLQSPYKLLPEFDELLAAILRRDPNGMLILTLSHEANWSHLLARRLKKSIPDVYLRIKWLPWVDYNKYLQILNNIDVLLLPPSFGGGSTSYDAFALGKPIVTLSSDLLRSRITNGLYRSMGVRDCEANTTEEFLDIAVKLGTDKSYHRKIEKMILNSSDAIFENTDAVEEFEALLIELGQQARNQRR
jgi:protein O-GlcNAc transferase